MSQERFYKIVTDSTLSARQKALRLTQEAEACLPYLPIKVETQLAMDEGILCDMFEGNAPYKPRYVLPDYAKFLANGSEFLELDPAVDLDDALHMLTILYHHVPSVTSLPVFFGHLDTILMPYIGNCSEAAVYTKLKRFWIMLDRIFPDAFTHANIGPIDNIVCRTILRIDAELKQIAPNLTFMYDPQVTPDSLMRQATTNICECSKPHIGNYPMHAEVFDQRGFGIVSCYNALPLAGGANTLTRINLKEIAQRSTNIEDFLQQSLPKYCDAMYDLIESRCAFLHKKSHFFDGFLASEGLISEDRFAPMFGIYGMAEAVNILLEKEGSTGKYGHSEQANTLSHTISEHLAIRVESTPVTYGYKGRALLHAQGGLNLDLDVTPGVRIPYGDEPDPVSYVQATAAHHKHYLSGISDILTIDETVKANPEAMFNLAKGALQLGFREFSANVESNDLVRVTGYMVKLSDIEKVKREGSRVNTTELGADAAEHTGILNRSPRVIAMELDPSYRD
jgi:YjjI family glycine radical enzyme